MEDKGKKVICYKPSEFDDMIKRAISKREDQLRIMLEKEERLRRIRREESVDQIKSHLSKLLSIPILVGFIASGITYYRFGWTFLEQQLLSWLIGATVVTTVIALMERYGNLRL